MLLHILSALQAFERDSKGTLQKFLDAGSKIGDKVVQDILPTLVGTLEKVIKAAHIVLEPMSGLALAAASAQSNSLAEKSKEASKKKPRTKLSISDSTNASN